MNLGANICSEANHNPLVNFDSYRDTDIIRNNNNNVDDDQLQIAIFESLQEQIAQTATSQSPRNSDHMNEYNVPGLTENEQLALAISLSFHDLEHQQGNNTQ